MDDNSSLIAKIVAPQLSKGDRKKIEILKGSIEVLGRLGAEALNYNVIGRELGINRSLVAHYFPDKIELLLQCVQVILLEGQNYVIEHVQGAKNEQEVLYVFADTTFEVFVKQRGHATIFLLLYHYCSINPKVQAFQESFRVIGANRVKEGVNQFRKKTNKKPMTMKQARKIQQLIRSAIIEHILEPEPPSLKAAKKKLYEECLQHAG